LFETGKAIQITCHCKIYFFKHCGKNTIKRTAFVMLSSDLAYLGNYDLSILSINCYAALERTKRATTAWVKKYGI